MTGVFCGDEIDGAKGVERAEGDIGEVADGCGDEVEHAQGLPAFGEG